MLSGNDISNLFDHEDLERISLDLKKEAIKQGIPDTKEAIFHFFSERVKQKLHLVLSTTPAGTSFRHRCRLYPPLINCCTIDWFDKWPLDALHSVAVSFLEGSEVSTAEGSNVDLMESVPKVFVEVYKSVEDETQKFYDELHRRYYTTPTSYMEFVRLFLSKLNEKRADVRLHRDRLCTGLQKLSESNSLVDTMKTELIQLGPKLEQKAKVRLVSFVFLPLKNGKKERNKTANCDFTGAYAVSASCNRVEVYNIIFERFLYGQAQIRFKAG